MTPEIQSMLRIRNKGLKDEKINILLVGPSEFCHIMFDTIFKCKKSFRISVSVAKTESIENVLKSSAALPGVDFIVFLMNTKERHCIEQVERNICLVEPVYLCDKIVLVNCCNHLGDGEMGLSYDELINLSQKYRLHMLHGNIKEEGNCENLAKRILHFGSVICGLKTGMPMMFDFPNFQVYS